MSICLTEYRCQHCHKLFFKGLLVEGVVEAKCRHCHETSVIRVSDGNPLLCMIKHCPNRIRPDAIEGAA